MSIMNMNESPISPTDAEVVQVEAEEYVSMPVRIEGPVRTQELPCETSGARSVVFTDALPKLVLSRDPRRARAMLKIITSNTVIRFSNNRSQADSDMSPLWAGTEVLPLRSRNELWVAVPSATVANPVTITTVAENWAY